MKKLALALAVIGLLAVGQGAQAVIATAPNAAIRRPRRLYRLMFGSTPSCFPHK